MPDLTEFKELPISEFVPLSKIDTLVDYFRRTTPDINEHLDTLTNLAAECKTVTEFGFRNGASAAALLRGKPEKFTTVDIFISKADCQRILECVEGTEIKFIEDSTLRIEQIPPTELLFIDTLHTGAQLKEELYIHGNQAQKYIAFHDTVTFGHVGEDGKSPGLMDAVLEFLEYNPDWKMHRHYANNNGLTVISRNSKDSCISVQVSQ